MTKFGKGIANSSSPFLACLRPVVCSFFFAILFVCSIGQASAQGSYETLRSDYKSLTSKDPSVNNLKRWEELGANLTALLESQPKHPKSAEIHFTLGRLFERTYQQRKSRSGLKRAIFFYEQVAAKHQGSSLADDALFRLGNLRRNGLKDEAGARAAFYEIIDVYPKGDMYQQARKSLGLSVSSLGRTPSREEVIKAAPPKEKPASSPSKSKQLYQRKSSSARPVIVIDPGHGGEDRGAVGNKGVLEKDVVLQIALMLDELLRERLRAQTVITRVDDREVPLAERTQVANKYQADIFISIHANASPRRRARGIETYYLDNTNDKSSLKLAQRENASMKMQGSDVGFIFSDLIQNLKLDDSISLAHHVQNGLIGRLGKYYKDVKDLGVKKAPFFVLVGAHMPCVLTEVSFIDHPVEGKRLAERRYQRLIAEAIYLGIRNYFEAHRS